MSRYAIDPMGVASLSGEISNTMRDVETSVDDALSALDAIHAVLTPFSDLREIFKGATDPRRRSGPELIGHAETTLAAVHRGLFAFIEGDEAMAATTEQASAASRLTPSTYEAARFGRSSQ